MQTAAEVTKVDMIKMDIDAHGYLSIDECNSYGVSKTEISGT